MVGADVLGLTSAQAARLLAENGPNRLPVQRSRPWWRVLAAEMVHFFAVLFWAAGVLAFVAGMPQLGVAIFVVVVLNGVFAFAQEERAQHAAERLRQMLPRRVTVLRDGRRTEISADDLVVGDVMLLAEGDRISADGQVLRAAGLAVDTSSMTGESVPERPAVADVVNAGCFVVEGEAQVTVTATGARTRLAGIAGLTAGQGEMPTPLRRELTRASRAIAGVAMAVGAVFFTAAVLIGMPPTEGFLFAVGVTVAVVPEGLLPTVTLSLAMGAQRMARRHALVRHLEAVQTLGSTTYICTDKTGTLTQNQMSVVQAWTPPGTATVTGIGYQPTAEVTVTPEAATAVRLLASVARRCSSGRIEASENGWQPRGDPMEAALDAFARRVGAGDPDSDRGTELARFPFDTRRRRMAVVVDGRVLVKGAPDAVLPLCSSAPGAAEALHAMATRGLRVLAVAAGDLASDAEIPASAQEAERDLHLLGLVALEDPPRPSVAAVLRTCRHAGIRVAMVTGDHPETAVAVAREIGLARTGDDGQVLLGGDLPEDLEELGELLDRDGMVIARVGPETKLRIARALQRRGHVVAMTGDGVNDAPALQEAAIGVAMGRGGTDVAREAADVVLLDDNFATIVTAIEEGRSTFFNIRRFLTYHLSDNVAELAPFIVWALSAGHFPLAIGVLQVLALDIGTDVFPALALGAEPPDRRTLDGPPVRGHLLDRAVMFRAFAVLGLAEAAVALSAFTASFLAAGWRPGEPFPGGAVMWSASGAAFTAIVLGQAANAFACRSADMPVWRVSVRTNWLLVVAVVIELALLLMLLYVPPVAALLTHAAPSPAGFLVATLSIPAVVLVDAAYKWFRRRHRRHHGGEDHRP
ncbi:cation-translocating P-type ATPase [Mycolicibacterium vanbaalenii]|uniref:ATPase, P-type (Transporting), HAD superfamily, subfamily IC n=1 Tax=Mycolicibacterium vanbaalenii (strain DSM 7251 / JCM 13017 / BCRC 16820 / KCTC 9966 / NRRL B-24157 / PYR-1) TaxID=350058 RepID=A1T4V9_MYCVP|nr:cation-transporting P-type ATPase [Mycolicibacterium vanbaalenii]ABM12209.1 ATPase, P-type (transporting), HAD superfamily, subfamily IC [Mycolicibacterium vanbaalenii PYR-1]